ncbi:ECF RNA polymerase sigma factor SigW [Stieleria maiorica]|uniref:RNA polymerase sigma factor n=1 Tax=Stieleria maiorica TaxID=2795974 RepID=A0A5B9M5A1_9BACT|nr:RNA polymerase sigma factor [Stieleria maiorica]QEF96281.1 ECF RNA polymerase sigma factor SigW [Stieleria maiorica]
MATRATNSDQHDRPQDHELVQRMLGGEQQAFREFVDRYQDRLFSSMLARTGCGHDAEEVVQETFIKAFQHLAGFKSRSHLYTWIYRIALNTSANRSRRRYDEVSLEASGADSDARAPDSTQPHIPLERLERVAMLRQALAQIEPRHRKILLLREFEERSYQEIAEIMQIPLGTVRSRLSRARLRLRETLTRVDTYFAAVDEVP